MKLILDCDGGVDDLIALMLSLAHAQAGDIELLMVSTTFGNSTCAAASRNMRCIIDTVNDLMTDNSKDGTELEVSVYHGADGPIVRPSPVSAKTWRDRGWPGHGKDGLGNALDELVEEFNFGYTVDDLMEQRAAKAEDERETEAPLEAPRIPYSERGALRMVEALEKAGDEPVTVVCIGPLTNLAVALALDPSAVHRIGRLVIMGGSETGKGNCSLTAEFNFHADPEAARAVFEAFEAPNRHNTRIELVTWDLSVDIGVSWAFMDQLVNGELSRHTDRLRRAQENTNTGLERVPRGEGSTACQRILGMTLAQFCNMCDDEVAAAEEAGKPDRSCVLCDVLALLIAINPVVVEDSKELFAMVEIGDGLCGGQVIFDWYNAQKRRANVTLVKRVQEGALRDAFQAVVDAFQG